MHFYEWITQHHYGRNTPEGDLAYDMAWDEYKGPNTYQDILRHLHRCGACTPCLEVFERAWKQYQDAEDRNTPTTLKPLPGPLSPPPPLLVGSWADSKRERTIFDLETKTRQALLEWIQTRLQPGHKWDQYHSSYGLKHIFTRQCGHYVTNCQFKDAMVICGYQPQERGAKNHHYKLHDLSPAFETPLCLARTHHLENSTD